MIARGRFWPGLLLTGSAGYVDAVGLLQLGYFVSFISGNTTKLGADLAGAGPGRALLPLALVLTFFLGGLAGSLLRLASRRWGRLAILALLLGAMVVAMTLSGAHLPAPEGLLPLALAGGAQNALLAPQHGARAGASFVSGDLFAASRDLARGLLRRAPAWRWLRPLAVWASLFAGALLGALANARWGVPALVLPAAIYLGFLIGAALDA
jgi:uncharacterized membrane protein YoaK (UPF0700 family)